MSKPAIEIRNLSKAYMIGHERDQQVGTMTFRDSLMGLARKPAEIFTGHQLKKEKFWALRDINLDIEQGDVVGIIGRNGSGKSTLLKVLSRIVEPTQGEIIMRGKVASLLEVGTGFHPELTGRENVYFNGAILGMTRREIQAKFDEIVVFSEVEKFLDTPVKFYSSGMYVRLAFAVAAHLDPDILIVDEVLAVGDAAFQKKCLGKMRDVAGQGRTVLFVSHSMDSVRKLCTKGVLMREGEVSCKGDISKVIDNYSRQDVDNRSKGYWRNDSIGDNAYVEFLESKIIDGDTKKLITGPVLSGRSVILSVSVDVLRLDPALTFGFALTNSNGDVLYWSYFSDRNEYPRLREGKQEVTVAIPISDLSPDDYLIELIGGIHNQEWIYQPGYSKARMGLTVIRDNKQLSELNQLNRPTILAPLLNWEIK